MEVWKDIVGFEGTFQVSDKGRVRSLDRTVTQRAPRGGGESVRLLRGMVLKQKISDTGRYRIPLYNRNEGRKSMFSVHRLVALAFIPNPEDKPQVNHKDGNPLNNNVDNLEWATCLENMQHAAEHNLMNYLKGEAHHSTKITEDDVKFIRENYTYRGEWNTTNLSKKFGVCIQTIHNVVNRVTWTHI